MNEMIQETLVGWSRSQFALTACYHWLFVPLTLGLAVVMAVMESIYVKTQDEFWKKAAQFWQKIFGINFAIGVATGIILEFEFGTNWSNYSWFVGDIFGAPLAIEGILAFFMEATFIAVMFFGWNKVSQRFHLASTWLTGLGATISAWWILVANTWMQHPVGMAFNPDTVRNEMVDFWAVAFQPMAVTKFFHTVSSGWMCRICSRCELLVFVAWKKQAFCIGQYSCSLDSGVGGYPDGNVYRRQCRHSNSAEPTDEAGCCRRSGAWWCRRSLFDCTRHRSPQSTFITCHTRYRGCRARHTRSAEWLYRQRGQSAPIC